MKKIILLILGAILIGGIFSLYMFNDLEKTVALVTSTADEVTLFQVGVFKEEKHALEYQKNFTASLIYDDKDYYRVIVAAYADDDCIQRIALYFKNQQITFYQKKIKVDKEFFSSLQKYEKLLTQSNDEVIPGVNKEILKELEKFL